MTTKPRPGELYRVYLERYAHELLMRAGASETEASDFAEILIITSCVPVLQLSIEDAGFRLKDWRAEKRLLARYIRQDRQRAIDAGYHVSTSPVEDPVYLNGSTPW